ncbi:PREDICTED: multidrug and toxin extrusion protein 2-like [Branchiostoma belcheri]|uniref:Multidrug and toxin extrusion protein n=1 Tax=Branchiostoma belcheri TaxID=7741 RepID=A0A6P4YK29_BRABE|nr:PREDICTED: multidrug and toxin extrusion protein 2-like [Branchiostoma belcheri]
MNLRRCFRVIFCPGFGSELRALTRLAWPTTVAFVLEYVMWMMPILFCGHLGKIQLDAVTLAISVVNVTGISLGIGLLTACDTLMAQTFGSDNKMRVGVILQRSILILLLSCFPCWSLYMNTEKLLLLTHQDPEVARLAGEFVTLFIPALPGVFLFFLSTKYLSTQGIVYPAMFINLFVNILNVPANYLCILYFGWGVRGAAIATGVTQYLLCFFMFLYIRVRKLHLQTWPGWRSDCLQEWGVYVKLAIAGLLMVCLESLTFEIGTLLTGLIGTVDLAAQGIIMTINSLNFMIPFAMGIAASIRVGNELGAGNAAQVKLSAKVSIFSFCCYAFVASIVLVSSRHVLGSVFTNDKEVVRLIGEVLPIVGVTQLADSVQAGCAGILRGCGKQKLGAIITFSGYYVLGLPFIAIFMFKLHLGVKGLYFGLGIATMFQCVSFLITIARTDWVQEARKAQDRAGVKAEEDASHCNGRIAKELERDDRFPNGSLGGVGACVQEMQSVAATLEDSTYSQHSLAHKYTEQETEFTTMPPHNRELSEMQEADTQHFLQETGSTDTEPLLDSLTSEVSDTSEVMVLSLEKLPFKVMVWRRLVAVAACLAILTVGVVVREFVPNPDFSYPPDCVTWTTVNGSLPLNMMLPWCNTTVTNMSFSEVTTLHHFSAGHRVRPEETTTTSTTTVTAKAGMILDAVVSRSLRMFSHDSKNSTFFFKTSFT